MERAECLVKVGGDPVITRVRKTGVSPAEVLVLRALHGNDAVTNVWPYGRDKVRSEHEIERLRAAYEVHQTKDDQGLIDRLFPGHLAQLPETFKQIGVTPERMPIAQMDEDNGPTADEQEVVMYDPALDSDEGPEIIDLDGEKPPAPPPAKPADPQPGEAKAA